MATIEEKRRRLDAKLQEMAEDGVLQGPSSATADFDPIDEERSVPEKTVLPAPPMQVAALRPLEEVSTIEEYPCEVTLSPCVSVRRPPLR